jgi:hypothetical protein
MTTSTAKPSPVKPEFDVSKYMVSSQIEEREVVLTKDTFTVKVKELSWSRKNQLVAKAMAFGGQTEGMSFDADYYVKECLKAMIVEAPWGKTTDVFLIGINDELGKALETIVPRAFGDADDDGDEVETTENLNEEPTSS